MATLIVAASLGLAVDAAEKKKVTTPGYDDPTIGVLGAHRSSDGAAPVNRNAAPPAPIAVPALPKVEAESPVIPGPGPGPAPLAAAPRPEASVEGAPVGVPAPSAARSGPVNSVLAAHPVLSGLIAGLIGTDLGSLLYGGPMMGDEGAAMIGYLVRVGLLILLAVVAVKVIWGLIGGARDDDAFAPRGPRREPSFEPSDDSGDGRREPFLGRERHPVEPPRRPG